MIDAQDLAETAARVFSRAYGARVEARMLRADAERLRAQSRELRELCRQAQVVLARSQGAQAAFFP